MSRAPRPRPAVAGPAHPRVADLPEAAGPDKQGITGDPLAAAIEPLWTIGDICSYARCSRRWVEGQRSAGRLPRPDARVGRCPRWRPETIRRWLETGGRP
jgi:hypothetical protein